ncbi:MAG: hypothetical protein ACREMZ_16770 [Gemmatimonadales bacterium]
MTPTPLREGYERMVRASGAQSRFIRRPSAGRVHVIEAGDGPPVVHLHGNNTSSLPHLMLLEHLTTVRSNLVDRPGSGQAQERREQDHRDLCKGEWGSWNGNRIQSLS